MAPSTHLRASHVGRGHLRASHADREDVVESLKAAFVQGRLAKDEFDARIGRTFGSRTYADLAATTADLPAGPAAPAPASPAAATAPQHTLTRPEKAVAWGLYGIVMTIIFTIAVVPGQTTVGVLATTAAVIYSSFWLLGGVVIVAARHARPRTCTKPVSANPVSANPVSRARGGAWPPPRA